MQHHPLIEAYTLLHWLDRQELLDYLETHCKGRYVEDAVAEIRKFGILRQQHGGEQR